MTPQSSSRQEADVIRHAPGKSVVRGGFPPEECRCRGDTVFKERFEASKAAVFLPLTNHLISRRTTKSPPPQTIY